MRNDHITKSNVFLKIGVMWYSASNTNNENVVDFLECAQQTCRRISSCCHRLTCTSDRWQFGANNTMGTNITQSIHIRFA